MATTSRGYYQVRNLALKFDARAEPSSPRHLQAQGKDNQFHRNRKFELFDSHGYNLLEKFQSTVDEGHEKWNTVTRGLRLGVEVTSELYVTRAYSYLAELPLIGYRAGKFLLQVRYKSLLYLPKIAAISRRSHGRKVPHCPTHGRCRSHKGVFCSCTIRKIDL